MHLFLNEYLSQIIELKIDETLIHIEIKINTSNWNSPIIYSLVLRDKNDLKIINSTYLYWIFFRPYRRVVCILLNKRDYKSKTTRPLDRKRWCGPREIMTLTPPTNAQPNGNHDSYIVEDSTIQITLLFRNNTQTEDS